MAPRPLDARPRTWTDPDGNHWYVTTRWYEVNGRAECTGIDIHSLYNDQPVTSTVLRALPVGRLVDAERRHEARVLGRMLAEESDKESADYLRYRQALYEPTSSKKGRPPTDPTHYVDVAKVYRKAHRTSRTPTKAVAEHWGVARSTAAKWVVQARKRGLLGETTPGKAGDLPRRKRKR